MEQLVFIMAISVVIPSIGFGQLGGWKSLKTHDNGVQKASQFAAKSISDRSNSMNTLKMVHVHEAKRQIVAGIKYNVTFDVGHTNCSKHQVNTMNTNEANYCIVDSNRMIDRCDATIWEKPWENMKALIHFQCSPFMDYHAYKARNYNQQEASFHRDENKI